MNPDNKRAYGHLIDSAIILITLCTLFIIPIIFNYFQIVSVFSELKLVTLHLGAGLISILWILELTLKRQFPGSISKSSISRDLFQSTRKNPIHFALVGAAIWIFAIGTSTLLSPLTAISFFGAEDNRSGYNFYDCI